MTNVVELPTAMEPEWREVVNTFREAAEQSGVDPAAAEFVIRRLIAINATVPDVYVQCLPVFASTVEMTADAYKARESALTQSIIGLLVEMWNFGAR